MTSDGGLPELPHISPALRTMSPDALSIWADANERSRALMAALRARETDDVRLPLQIARVDDAVVEALRALALPRGPIRGVFFQDGLFSWLGRKTVACELWLSTGGFRELIARGESDAVFRTWVHESIHARGPFSSRYRSEYLPLRGYEEGLVEGLTRLVTNVHAGMDATNNALDFYVVAYTSLARAFGVESEVLLRIAWQAPPGEIRASFGSTVEALAARGYGKPLTSRQHHRLMAVADRLMASDRIGYTANEAALLTLWKAALT